MSNVSRIKEHTKESNGNIAQGGVDVSQFILSWNGEPVQDSTGEPITLRYACCTALMASAPAGQTISAVDHHTRFSLAQKIHNETVIVFTPEEKTLLRDQIVKCFTSPSLVAPARDLLA